MAYSRHFGLIGGLGVGATTLYYERIAAGNAACNIVPRITVAHAHAPNALALVTAGKIEELAEYLAGFAKELEAAGATFFAIPAITPHICLAELQRRILLPVVNMLEVTAQGLQQRKLNRVALFGTRFTIEGRMFGALEGFDIVSPTEVEIAEIHRIYLELATTGYTPPSNIDTLRNIAQTLQDRDHVETILLAGTDLNLVLDESTAGFPAFDCAAAHIEAIIQRMLS